MRTVIYLDVLLLVNFVVGAAFLLAAGVLFAAAAGGRRGSGGSVVAGPAGPHRPLAAGPYL